MQPSLPTGYSIREMTQEEFQPLWQKHAASIFDESQLIFRPFPALPESEQQSWKELGKNMGQPFHLRLGLYHGEEFVGWHTGNQESGETFYMRNSAVLPAHRRKGLYRALLADTLGRLKAKGFQKIYSRHNATNNDVIIPKLQAGFVITGLELSDAFGTLVHLAYFTNPLRRKMLEFRSGDLFPDQEIRDHLKL
jgi:GNAT superfamily N-acetyltransferase